MDCQNQFIWWVCISNSGIQTWNSGSFKKNAINFVFAERNDIVVGFASYGIAAGFRAGEQLLLVIAQVKGAIVWAQVHCL